MFRDVNDTEEPSESAPPKKKKKKGRPTTVDVLFRVLESPLVVAAFGPIAEVIFRNFQKKKRR